MSRKCSVTGKSFLKGHTVSHSRIRSRKLSLANLKIKRLYDSESKRWVRIKVSTRVLRTIDKKGLSAALRDYGLKLEELMV